MPEKKLCRVCRRWFTPDPRAGKRQRVCAAAECQSERRRRNAAAWREEHAEELEAGRHRSRLQASPIPTEDQAAAAPLSRLSTRQARIAVGLKTQVLDEYAKVVLSAQLNESQCQRNLACKVAIPGNYSARVRVSRRIRRRPALRGRVHATRTQPTRPSVRVSPHR